MSAREENSGSFYSLPYWPQEKTNRGQPFGSILRDAKAAQSRLFLARFVRVRVNIELEVWVYALTLILDPTGKCVLTRHTW